MVSFDVDSAGTCADLCEKEQTANFKKYVLGTPEAAPAGEWSSRGPRSVSPFSPCAETRIPHIFAAARLTAEDVLYDLGCGDGRVLHEAAARFGCRCVGIEIDEECLVACREGSAALGGGLEGLFTWRRADFTEFGDDFFSTGRLPGASAPLPPATVVMVFITGHGLVALADWLHRAWRHAGSQGVRLLTCVEALDTARDYNDGVFAETNLQGWEVYRDPVHAQFGVFVVPPCGCGLDAWCAAAPVPRPLANDVADESVCAIVPGLLSSDETSLVRAFATAHGCSEPGVGEAGAEAALANFLFEDGDFCAEAEDALHALPEHRVLHLHAEGVDAAGDLAGVRARLLGAMYKADEAEGWRLLRGRSVYVRSFEHHGYGPGGSVMDPEHRDQGSLLTISVLLSRSDDCEGGLLRASVSGAWRDFPALRPGDAAIFMSHKRHGVTPITRGSRESLVLELWEGGVNRRNRHQ